MKYYPVKYPTLPVDLLLYFVTEGKDGVMVQKTVSGFCEYLQKTKGVQMPSPQIVSQICEIMTKSGHLYLVERGGIMGMGDRYLSLVKGHRIQNDIGLQSIENERLSHLIYGFRHTYERYKQFVQAVKFFTGDDDFEIGTSFFFFNFLITARHCIEGSKCVGIDGVSIDQLQKAKIFFHVEENVDIAVIELPKEPEHSIVLWEEAEVLDEVITIGFPRTAGFHKFPVTEKAQISSRLTVSKGAVVGSGADIWMKKELYLINARIRGGNSGGPVINSRGAVIGVAVQKAEGEGKSHDELGYGTVIPMKYVFEDLLMKKHVVDVTAQHKFVPFE